MTERSLVVFKPDSVQRGIVGEILTRFERAGLKIVAMKMVSPEESHYFEHYETIGTMKTRHGDQIFDNQVKTMMHGPVIAMVLEGVEAIETIRKMVGSTEPKTALPGTIRGDYAHFTYGMANAKNTGVPNIVHASADPKEAKDEVALWFGDDEIQDYRVVHEEHTHGN